MKSLINVSFVVLTLLFISFKADASAIGELTSSKKAAKTEKVSVAKTTPPRITSNLKKHSAGIGLGQTFVLGDFEDHGENKISWDLLYNYSASHSFDLLAGFHSSKHTFRNEYSRVTGLTASIKAKLYQFDSFAPFALAGLGFYAPKVKRLVNNSLVESESKIVFGTNIGAGADLRLNEHFTVGAIAHYHNPFDMKQEVGPQVEGSYFKLLITTLYTF